MTRRNMRKILTRISWLNDKLIDLKNELKDQKFPVNTPLMKDLEKIKRCLMSILDHLDESIQMRDDACKFFLEEESE